METSKESVFKVTGMDCEDEVKAVKTSLISLSGVEKVEPNLMSSRVRVVHTPGVSTNDLIGRISAAGLTVVNDSAPQRGGSSSLKRSAIWVVSCGCALGAALVLTWTKTGLGALIQVLSFAAIGLGGVLIFPKAWRGLRSFSLDMNVLMSVAVIGAIAIGEYVEAGTVVFLFSLAEWLESFSLERARRSVQSLLKLVPETALVQVGSKFEELPVAQVQLGQTIRVRSGSRIPLDGIVIKGESSVNQAPITGESLPVERRSGDRVLGGTINGEGSLEIKVSALYQNTKIAQIIRLIEEAQSQKAPAQRFVDAFAKYYTPIVFVFALLILTVPPLLFSGDWHVWFYRALVMLVIACPCALVIATPVSIVSGLTAMAKKGILIKGGASLETIGKLKSLAVDKTGTITEGAPRVLTITPRKTGLDEKEVLRIAAAIDAHSTHPLAKAVVQAAKERNVAIPESTEYRSFSGRGAEASIGEHIYFVGNHRFAHESAVCSEELEALLASIEDKAQSVVVVGHRPHVDCQGEVLGVLGLGDAVRDDAKEAIQALHNAGILQVVMLSGDNQRTVNAIAKQVGIGEAYGDLLPEDKVLKIKDVKKRFGSVAMIGDGVNDAPAMATATLGIAMGASGTDAAIETSDVTLMQDRLTGIADAIVMGKRTLRVIWFNTGLALVTKLVFLGLSITGHASLWLAIAADTGATLFVIANSLRLLK